MPTFDAEEHPHRRFNPLNGRWILVSPHRTKRPWQGRQDPPAADERPAYDPSCYLCPGNTRAGGTTNPPYDKTYIFDNDFAALLDDVPAGSSMHPLFRSDSLRGSCRVICFSPRHDLTLAGMKPEEIRVVVDVWAEEAERLGRQYQWVQLFENKGELMGCSNPHPHGQVWAQDVLPDEAEREDAHQRVYLAENGARLLSDYGEMERERNERVVVAREHWTAVVPYWALWPFETLLIPRRPVAQVYDLTDDEREDLAHAMQELLVRYDNLFSTSFPYSMGWHGAPNDGTVSDHWQLHAHFCPPLLRSASVRKFMVGYEMMAEPQRDLTPEQAARRLCELPTVHWKRQGQGEAK